MSDVIVLRDGRQLYRGFAFTAWFDDETGNMRSRAVYAYSAESPQAAQAEAERALQRAEPKGDATQKE